MRLENNDRALISKRFDSIQKCLKLARMVRVIVVHIRAVEFALKLKSSARSGKACKTVFYCRRLYAEADAGRRCGQGVLDVVYAGDVQRHAGEELAVAVDVELAVGADAVDVARVDVGLVGEAEGEELATQGREGVHGVAVVDVGDDLAALRHLGGEFAEGALHVLQVGEVVEVVGLNVEDDGYRRAEVEERVVILAALKDDGVPAADAVSGVQQGQRAAYHDGRVPLRGHEDVGAHAGGRGLAVGARDAQGVVVVLHYGAPGLCALENGHAAGAGLDYLGVVVMHRGGADDELDVGRDVHGRVGYLDVYAQAAQIAGLVALGHV